MASLREFMPLLLAGASMASPAPRDSALFKHASIMESSNDEASANFSVWSDAVLRQTSVTSVVGTLTVPTISMLAGGDLPVLRTVVAVGQVLTASQISALMVA